MGIDKSVGILAAGNQSYGNQKKKVTPESKIPSER
jgi:hypothetical protein